MSDGSPVRARQNCCRLCLAPGSECISILNSYAADKEPLSTKIHNCVNIKISADDRLSLRICHACISYLNSWQSFKNRCIASQGKQRSWLDATKRQQLLDNNVSISISADGITQQSSSFEQQHHHPHEEAHEEQQSSLASSILDGITSLKKRKSLTVYVSPKETPKQLQSLFHVRKSQKQPPPPLPQATITATTAPSATIAQQHQQHQQQQHLQQQSGASATSTAEKTRQHCKPAKALQSTPRKPRHYRSRYSQQQKQMQQQQQQQMQQELQKYQQQLQQQTPQAQTQQSQLLPQPQSHVQPTPQMSLHQSQEAAAVKLLQEHPLQPQPQSQFAAAATSFQSAAQQLRLFRRYSYNPLPAVEIKDEPLDPEDDYNNSKQQDESDDMVDPTFFLECTEAEADEAITPQLGYQYESARPIIELATISDTKEASCRACNLKFSTRANARRHERNLHPNLFELSTSTPNNMPVTKPTPALVAALELQRASAAAAAAAEASKPSTGAITQQKYRQEIVNAFNKCETGGYDYENPEKYQHYLTDEKIVFLQQNEEFLRQYQNMTCRCCNKYYSTYKNFMAHMRKKYATLPRNLCFNCLKLNDSKALFISHLKRRNCINLYKVLHSLMGKNPNFAAAVTATAAAVPDKLRAKELLVNKMYECKLCPKKYRLKLEFRSHVYDEHADMQRKDTMQKQCCYCGLELDDPAERKRHYNNMDCIVSLRCVTCDAKFDNHQKFLDHVYEKHLATFGDQTQFLQHSGTVSTENSPGKKSSAGLGGASSTDESRSSQHANSNQQKSQYFSRMPQACPICDQQYNNYNNVLRHMESKHPDQLPQTYKCVKCGIGYPRLSNLREHMVQAHAADKARHTGFEYIVNADAVKIAYGGNTQNVYTGRYDYVMKDLMSITNGGTIDDDDNSSEHTSKKMRIDNGTALNTSTSAGSSGNVYSSLKECPICNAVFSNNIGLSNHMRSHSAAAQNAASTGVTATKSAPSSLTITPAPTKPATPPAMQNQTPQQKAIFKRSLEQAADRRFRRMRCRLCQRRFSSKKSYRFHMLNDHQIRNVQFIKCKLCDAEFAYEKGLKVHMFKIHNTLLKDEMIVKQFECDICSIVYRSEDQLLQHKKSVHGNESARAANAEDASGSESVAAAGADQSGMSTPISGSGVAASAAERSVLDTSAAGSGPLYWYQCKYCPSNFNTNKKLAIHINSHDEFDSNDYSCKDCGNVYSGRKSLWVHRYKKHPQFPEPSECVLCKKVFFDSQMLENHIPTCNRKPITASGTVANSVSSKIYKHKTGDDDEDETSHDTSAVITTSALGGGELEITPIPAANIKIKLPEVACTMCGQCFTDQDLFSKHIQMHEMELYTDNPLAAMFDTGPADPNQFYLDRVNDNGEYACDLCNKTFTQMTALKVHRKWHFRGDSKQNHTDVDQKANATPSLQTQINHRHPLGLQAVGLMPNPRPSSKSQKRKRELKCEYCPSTFISNNNLRRHIYELHRDEIGNLPEPPKIKTDEYLHCRRCNQKFETKVDWVEHKVADARVTKPFGPFQWGCDLCGAYVSRKEKLINHIYNHLKEKEIIPVEKQKSDQNQNQHQHRAVAGKTTPSAAMKVESDSKAESDDGAKEESEEEAMEGGEDYDDEADEDGYDEEVEQDEYVEDGGDVMQVDVSDNANDGQNDDEDGENDDEDAEDDDDDGDEGEDVDDGEGEAQGDDGPGDGDGEGDDDDDDAEMDDDDGDVDEVNDDAINGFKAPLTTKISIAPIRNSTDTTTEAEDSPSYDEDDDADNDTDADSDAGSVSSTEVAKEPEPKARFSCDLCLVFFDTQQELQKHVKLHFLNGPGSVTLTEIKPKSTNKSRSSSSDVVTV